MDTTTDVYGSFDVPAAFNRLLKNESDIAGRQASDFNLSQALQVKQITDTANSATILSALQTKGLTDQSASQALSQAIATKNLTDDAALNLQQMTQFERDIQNRIGDNKWQASKDLADVITDVKNQLRGIELSQVAGVADNKYNSLANTSAILQQMAADKYDVAKDKIDALREKHEDDRHRYGLAIQSQELTNIKQMMNSIDQNQQFASKTVQFGAGNSAGTAQTANQAWCGGPDLGIVLNTANSGSIGNGGTVGNSVTPLNTGAPVNNGNVLNKPNTGTTTGSTENNIDITVNNKDAIQIVDNAGNIDVNSGTVINVTNNIYEEDNGNDSKIANPLKSKPKGLKTKI